MAGPRSILMVCMGNICRSPTAAGVLRELIDRDAPTLELLVDAAGTHAYHVGEPPDPRSAAAAGRRGYSIGHLRARQVADEDFARFDVILAMDRANLAALARRCPADRSHTLHLFLEFAGGGPASEVPDPYYGTAAEFDAVVTMVEQAARSLIAKLRAD